MLGHKNLVGGIEGSSVDGAALDLEHAVKGGCKHHHESGGDGREDDGAPSSLDPIQRYY